MLRRVLTENLGLKLLALFLAIGLVYVRAREEITKQGFSSVLIELTGIPQNMVPANPERTYTTSIVLQGPQTVLNFLTPKDLRFTLDLSEQKELIENHRLLRRLRAEDLKFTPHLEKAQQQQLTLPDEEIHPSQVLVIVNLWNIDGSPPTIYTSETSGDIVEIPLYQLIKNVPVHAPTSGKAPPGRKVFIETIPKIITVTGPQAALDRISEVTTTPINLTSLTESLTTEAALPELARLDSPVSATTTRVTVKIKVSRAKGGK